MWWRLDRSTRITRGAINFFNVFRKKQGYSTRMTNKREEELVMDTKEKSKMTDREAYKFMRWGILALSLLLAVSFIPH